MVTKKLEAVPAPKPDRAPEFKVWQDIQSTLQALAIVRQYVIENTADSDDEAFVAETRFYANLLLDTGSRLRAAGFALWEAHSAEFDALFGESQRQSRRKVNLWIDNVFPVGEESGD